MVARSKAATGFCAVMLACSGRPTASGGGSSCADPIGAGDLVITEVMANPAGADEGREWFEVFNASGCTLDLTGLTVVAGNADGSSTARMPLSAVTIEPGRYLVFGSAMPAAAPAWMDVPYATALGSLRNSDGRLALVCGETVIDAMTYASAPDGASWSLDGSSAPDAARNDDPGAWCEAASEYEPGQRGTPGAPNAACASTIPPGSCWDGHQVRALRVPGPGDLVINEFHAKPAAVSYQRGEWVELFVASDVDLNGLELGNSASALTKVVEDAACRSVRAGTYLVFIRNLDPMQNGGVENATGKLPFGLTDSGMTLVVAVAGTVLDEVAYQGAWVQKGASTALDPSHRDPVSNDVWEAWCHADTPYGAGDLGTPGAANPACP